MNILGDHHDNDGDTGSQSSARSQAALKKSHRNRAAVIDLSKEQTSEQWAQISILTSPRQGVFNCGHWRLCKSVQGENEALF